MRKLAKKVNLSEIRKSKYKKVIKHCEVCGGIVIDDDRIPHDVVVDYDDRNIYSELRKCEICDKVICANCSTKIEDRWDVFYICPDCRDEHIELINKIDKLKSKHIKISDKIDKLVNELRNI